MRLLSLALYDWRRFREGPHAFDFAADGTVIAGPNESGKSTIFDAVRRTLFDRNRTGSHWAHRLVPYGSAGATPRAILEFELGGRRLRIEKSFGPSGTARLSEVAGDGKLADIARSEQATEELLSILKARAGSGRGGSRPVDWGAFQWLFMPQVAEDRTLPGPGTDAPATLGLRQAGVSRDYDLVLEAARKECDRWYTSGKRIKTGSELKSVEEEIEGLESQRRLLQEQIDGLETKRSRYDDLEEQLPRLKEDLAAASAAWDVVQNEAVDLTEAQGRLREAQQRLQAQACLHAAEEAERVVRERQRRETEAAQAQQGRRRLEIAAAEQRIANHGHGNAAREEAARLGSRTREVRTELLSARDAHELQEKTRQLDDLRARCGRAEELDGAILQAKRSARGEPPDAEVLAQARRLEAELRANRYALGEVQLRVSRRGELEVLLDGIRLESEEGTALEQVVVGAKNGEVRVVREARQVRRLQTEAEDRERELAVLLDPYGVATAEELQALREERLRAAGEIASLHKQREALEARSTEALHARIAELESEIATLHEKRSVAAAPRFFALDGIAVKAEIAALEEEKEQTDRAFQHTSAERKRLQCLHDDADARDKQVRGEMEAAQEREKRAARDLDQHRDEYGSTEACRKNLEDRQSELEAVMEEDRRCQDRLQSLEKEAESRRTTARLTFQRAQDALNKSEAEMRLLEAELEREAAKGAWTRLAEIERRLEAERSRRARLELKARAALRLKETLEAVRAEVVERVVAPIKGALDLHLAHVTAGRYALAQLDQDLQPRCLSGASEVCEFEDGSEGLRELVNTLVRLSVAVELSKEEPQALILDDPCVHVSRERTSRLVELLNRLMTEHPLQVVVLTHRRAEFGGLRGRVLDLSGVHFAGRVAAESSLGGRKAPE